MNTDLLTLGTFITSFGTLVVAVFALHSWKKQFNTSLKRDFVLSALDAVYEISQLNFKIVDKFNDDTYKDQLFLLNSESFLNPILANHAHLIEEFNYKITNLSKCLNRLTTTFNDKYLEEITDQYLMCLYELGEYFTSEKLTGFKHSDRQNPNVRRWGTDWLDKACDKEMMFENSLETHLIKLLKV
ncbi:hypothetical protein [Acinetobacter wanghuae]|uniref:hypothetical protein n=1 Tax=Acinetobacter wanghuae TaxID=2662362 RepID=UPI003AF54F57